MQEITILSKEELETNPEVVGENLRQLAIALQETRGDLETIKNRNFWKKITSNNTRDLAEAMLRQNDSISAFLVIVQGIVFLSMNNVVVLGGVMDALNKAEVTNEERDNEYVSMAKEYLGEALKNARRTVENERKIKQLTFICKALCLMVIVVFIMSIIGIML